MSQPSQTLKGTLEGRLKAVPRFRGLLLLCRDLSKNVGRRRHDTHGCRERVETPITSTATTAAARGAAGRIGSSISLLRCRLSVVIARGDGGGSSGGAIGNGCTGTGTVRYHR